MDNNPEIDIMTGLRDNRGLLNTIIETEPACVKLLSADCRLLMMNRAGLDMIEADSFGQVKGLSVLGLILPEHRQAFIDVGETVFKGGEAELEFEIVGLKGRRVWLETHAVPLRDDTGGITALLGITRDVTERKRVEDALRKSEARLAEAEIIAGFGSWEWMVADDSVYWSEGMCKLFGISPVEFGGAYMSFIDFVHPVDRDRVMCLVSEAVQGDEPLSYEARIVRKDGEERMIYVYGHTTRDDEGRPVRMLGTVQDVTKRRELEQERELLQEVMRHDMKTPLAVITGNAEILLMEGGKSMDRESAAALESIIRNAGHLGRMLDDQVTLFNIESGRAPGNKEQVDVEELLMEASMSLSGLARGKGLSYDSELPAGLPSVYADRSHLLRAVANLGQNAVNYTPAGGKVRLAARLVGEGSERRILILVTDDGPGIPAAEQSKVFEKYYRNATAKSVSGSGLGLAIVKAVAEENGGWVELESGPGKGCVFTLVLPVADGTA